MSSPFDEARKIRDKYRNRAEMLLNMIVSVMHTEKDPKAIEAFASVIKMMKVVKLLSKDDDENGGSGIGSL